MRTLLVALVIATPLFSATAAPQGLWDGTVIVGGVTIPFRMEFSGSDAAFTGSFFNGDAKITSTNGQIRDGVATLEYPYYGKKLTASLTPAGLDGKFGLPGKEYPFHAAPHRSLPPEKAPVPSIAGTWEVLIPQPKDKPSREKSWRMVVTQTGPNVSAAILRLDGDTGALTGEYRNGKFVLGHFDGARPSVVEVTPMGATLHLKVDGAQQMNALRPAVARQLGFPEPTDAETATVLKNLKEPLRFSFPDLNGHIVSSADPQFKNKVVIVEVSGSWCPNCHDEAPLLEDLYRTYHAQGLEVVELSFELEDQLKTLSSVRAFVKRYSIGYTVLIPGDSAHAAEKLPQLANFYAFPTTLFVGRDGLVHAIHTGFAAKATGELHDELVGQFTSKVRQLLATR